MDEVVRRELAAQLAAGRMMSALHLDVAELSDDENAEAVATAATWLDAADAAGLVVVSPNPDRAHSRERTAYTADVMAVCARVLAYAAEGRGLSYPADVYRLVVALNGTAYLMEEVSRRCADWLVSQGEAGRLKLDRSGPDGDVGEHVDRASAALIDMGKGVASFRAAADRARHALERVAAVEDEAQG